jgi:hypothetical protein
LFQIKQEWQAVASMSTGTGSVAAMSEQSQSKVHPVDRWRDGENRNKQIGKYRYIVLLL